MAVELTEGDIELLDAFIAAPVEIAPASVSTVAKRMGISPNTAKCKFLRLRDRLWEHGIQMSNKELYDWWKGIRAKPATGDQ